MRDTDTWIVPQIGGVKMMQIVGKPLKRIVEYSDDGISKKRSGRVGGSRWQ
jgi:hypothetical protein